jgi:hypothetical protein
MKSALSYALSGRDIQSVLGDEIPIHSYGELADFSTIQDAWGPRKAMVILYETEKHSGHWCCVFEQNNKILVFDSYGFIPDKELKWIDGITRKELDEDIPHLSYLLYNANRPFARKGSRLQESPVEYNNYKLQQMREGVATCGRWVIARLLLRHMSVDHFARIFMKNRRFKNLSPDEIVVRITEPLLGS